VYWNPGTPYSDAIAQIKQAFAEEARIEEILQDMVNLRANMQQDMLRLGLTYKGPGFMTGQEWFTNFRAELDKLPTYYDDQVEILKAAQRAAGITND
jgi:hypothetical protein